MSERIDYHIRYLGFESLSNSGRRLDYALTARGRPSRKASVEIPSEAFTGPNRVTFQECAAIGYEKVRRELSLEGEEASERQLDFVLTIAEIGEISPRHRPKPESS